MQNSFTRRFVLCLVLTPLCGTVARAATTTPDPTPQSVTGTDPVPTSPNVVIVMLTLLQTLL
jgi:hypothetical protein